MSSLIPDTIVQVAAHKNPGYVVVEGPIGAGKTTLAQK